MRIVLALFITILSLVVNAQENSTFNLSLLSNNQQLIKDAVENGIFEISHSYQLEDTTTHQKFGRYGKNEFGTGYALGIKVIGGIITTERLVEPWKYDINYQKYKGSHKPVSYKIEERQLNDTIIAPSFCQPSNPLKINGEQFAFLPDSTVSKSNGLSLDSIAGEKDGWIVWVVADNSINSGESINNSSLIIHKFSIQSDTIPTLIKTPNTDKHIWGGIFIVPTYPSLGSIEFVLSGVITQNDTNNWLLNLISPNIFPERLNDRDTSDLTPVISEEIIEDVDKKGDGSGPADKKKKSKKKSKKNE